MTWIGYGNDLNALSVLIFDGKCMLTKIFGEYMEYNNYGFTFHVGEKYSVSFVKYYSICVGYG